MKCLNCGVELAADDRFCAKCGFKVESTVKKICKECGKKLAEDAMFCSGCGSKLELPSTNVPASETNVARTAESAPAPQVQNQVKTEAENTPQASSLAVNAPVQTSGIKSSNKYIVPDSVYFATYIAISDNRLFDREWYRIEDVIKEMGFDDDIRNNVLNIILDRQEKIKLDQVIDGLVARSPDIRYAAMRLALEVAYSDGSFGEKESVVFQSYRAKLGIDRGSYSSLCKEVQTAFAGVNTADGSQVVIRAKSLYERYEKCLFSAEVYADVIKDMSVIAKEDIVYASAKVDRIAQMYRVYPQMLKKQTDSIISHQSHLNNNEDKQQLQSFFKELLDSIDHSLESANESVSILRERQGAASNSFTISFMGRTKAGKSTLHSVLLGGLNNDFIGRGSERTTRYNYVYDFEGMRIIDTPGIGAPGGKSDTEIATEVADESDLICYVVTSDSIQETEFNFLKQLKDRNKPVLIMLNKKDNITRSEKKLQAFIDNPLGWFESDGEDSIQGHINRINTYIEMNLDFHNYHEVVPVHLLAAKLALKETDPEKKEKLLEGSRINIFLKTLSEMVSGSGIIKRSQTIYNSAVYHLEEDKKLALEQIEVVSSLKKEFKKNSEETISKIKTYSEKKRNDFITSFNSTFDAFLKEDVRRFADENYNVSSKELNSAWKTFLKNSDLEKRLESSYDRNWEQYQSRVQDILIESEEDLNFSMEFGALSNVKVNKIVNVKLAVGVLSSVLGIAAAVFFAFSNPVGWVLTGASVIAGIVAALIKSKDKQIDTAKGKLYESLVENVEKMRDKNLTELLKKYDTSRNTIIQQISNYNNAIDISLGKIHQSMDELSICLTETIQDLNNAYGARIANFMIKAPFYDLNDSKSMSPLSVEREFKKYILLKDERLYIQPIRVDKDRMSDILQEKVYLNEEVETNG